MTRQPVPRAIDDDALPGLGPMALAIPVFAVTMAICALLGMAGWWMTAVILAILIGGAIVPLVRPSVTLIIIGLILNTIAGMMAAGVETPLFGPTVSGIRIDQAAAYPNAAIFHFTDGRVLTGNDTSIGVYGTNGRQKPHEIYRMRIAPVVGDGWTRDQPITVWAIGSSPNSDMPRTPWTNPSRAGVRAVTNEGAEIRDAIADLARWRKLRPVPNPLLIHWIDDPEAAVASQRWRLVTVFVIAAIAWAIAVAIISMAALVRQRR